VDRLERGKVLPQVFEAISFERVVWSSFWPLSPDDIIEMNPGCCERADWLLNDSWCATMTTVG